jgi:hypothetical protein
VRLWYWLSFADNNGSRGAAVVQGDNFRHAVDEAWRLGINPGGEVFGAPLPPGLAEELYPEWLGMLIPRDVLLKMESVEIVDTDGKCVECERQGFQSEEDVS